MALEPCTEVPTQTYSPKAIADIPVLKSAGVAEIFTPGTTTQSVVDWVNEHVSVRR